MFPGRREGSSTAPTLTPILKDCNVPALAHGFRSTFRDWAVEETDHPREVIEAALAHVVGNKLGAVRRHPPRAER